MPDEIYRGEREAAVRDAGSMPMQNLSRGPSEAVGSAQGIQESSGPKKPRPISIEAKDHGFIVTVGCQTLCIERASTLIRNLEKYLVNPAAFEKAWLNGEIVL